LNGRKKLGAAAHLGVDALQDAQAKLAIAFHRDRPGMGKLVHRVGLEFGRPF